MKSETKVLIGVIAAISAVMIGAFAIANRSASSTEQADINAALVREDSHKKGTGSVMVVEFGDFQCPVCEKAYPILNQIKKDYEGKITFVFRNFPITTAHKNAMSSAQAAEAAGIQGKFWEMHDKLYGNQNSWATQGDPTDIYVGYATDIGLDTNKFKDDMKSNAVQQRIDNDIADANTVGVTGTPSIYINGKKAADYTYATLKGMIDEALGSSQ